MARLLPMSLDIIILNWNQAEDTIACARRAQTWPVEAKRIWVVDNASRPEGAQRLAEALSVPVCAGTTTEIIYSDTNRGFAGGNNLALARALQTGCRAVLLLNNDAQVDVSAAQHLQLTLAQHPQIGIVGPVLVDTGDPSRLLSAGGRDIAYHLSSHILDPLQPGELRFVDYVPGTCVMIRAEVLREVGLLDEAYFFGGEVADLCARARQQGWLSAVDGSAIVQHAVNRSAIIRRRLHLYYVMRNRFLYIRKFYPRRQLPLFALWTLYGLYTAGLAMIKRQPEQVRTIGLGCLDGWRGRFGGQNARVTRGQIT